MSDSIQPIGSSSSQGSSSTSSAQSSQSSSQAQGTHKHHHHGGGGQVKNDISTLQSADTSNLSPEAQQAIDQLGSTSPGKGGGGASSIADAINELSGQKGLSSSAQQAIQDLQNKGL